ncbi:RidA family protein [Gordonia terrae]
MTPRAVHVKGLDHGTNPIPAAARRGPLVATSNVFGRRLTDGKRPTAPADEFQLAFAHLGTILTTAGASVSDLFKVDVRISGAEYRELLNDQWVTTFPDPDDRPARHVTTGDIPAGFRLQISALAYVIDTTS